MKKFLLFLIFVLPIFTYSQKTFEWRIGTPVVTCGESITVCYPLEITIDNSLDSPSLSTSTIRIFYDPELLSSLNVANIINGYSAPSSPTVSILNNFGPIFGFSATNGAFVQFDLVHNNSNLINLNTTGTRILDFCFTLTPGSSSEVCTPIVFDNNHSGWGQGLNQDDGYLTNDAGMVGTYFLNGDTSNSFLADDEVINYLWIEDPSFDGRVDAFDDTAGSTSTNNCLLVNCNVEICDGVDNDGDGEIDEGFDTDSDGIADCFDNCPNDSNPDQADCDGDGIGDVCEPDTDGDGIPDDCDTEECDGLDNDGDGEIDEGFDTDGDGIADCFDNCPNDSNPDQADCDGDGIGDVCEPDTDGDGIPDDCDTEECDGVDNDGDGEIDEGFDTDSDGIADCFDNCPNDSNPDQADCDGDGIGDVCEPDTDGDGIPDDCDTEECDGVDNDGDGEIDEGFDTDGDGIADCFDNCPNDSNPDQADCDGDGIGDACEPDTDGDGIPDDCDTEECDGVDNDGDGEIDEGFDTDGDGIADCFDNCPNDSNPDQADCDGDGIGDVCEPDTDGDGIPDDCDTEECDGVDNDGDGEIDEGFDIDSDGIADCFDNCPNDSNPDQADCDGDGIGDACEQQDCDNDGIPDEQEPDCDGDGIPDDCEPDTDGDGIPDDCDTEECDGLDNDGDGEIDEGFDTDSDGIADCFDNCPNDSNPDQADCDGDGIGDVCELDTDGDGIPDDCDTEECDGVDNDGDGEIDEGFDIDSDGIADCFDNCPNDSNPDQADCDGDGIGDVCELDTDGDGIPDDCDTEECDGLDNDGDGEIDEGFDTDSDGIADCFDNCPNDSNPDQADCDGDGIGDVCELDTDGDGIPDDCDTEECDGVDNDGDGEIDEGFDIDSDGIADCFDNCPNDSNPDQADCDGDGIGDVCELDTDGDGIPDDCDTEECDGVDNDGDGEIDEGFDIDSDGIADCFDNCPNDSNPDQADCDGDGIGDVCELDTDGDGIPDDCDTEECDGVDNDGDGEIDEGFDTDGDGIADCFDNCPNDSNPDQADCDGDGVGDVCEPDTDGDGIPDDCDTEECDGVDNDGDGEIDEGFDTDSDGIADCFDNCPNDSNPDQADCDGDGIGDVCEPDTDGDGIPDDCDTEECDGVDNDGDGEIDEGFDIDSDGIADCFDNCPNDSNPDQLDSDGDGIGDACEQQDCDNDGIPDEQEPDCDGDGIPDDCEPDIDGDGIPDDCDTEECDGLDNDGDGEIDEGFDTDSDGIANCFDNCPNDSNPDQADCDGDGIGDVCELDTDGDGIPDDCDTEECDGVDNDGDGEIDEGFDIDSDGIADCFDNCPNDSNPDQLDSDGDGIGDACEQQDCDNDGIPDEQEPDCDGDGIPDDCEIDSNGDGVPDNCEAKECETAFARSTSETTCFIDDGFSRWGWTNKISANNVYNMPIYAGAGQCDLGKGTLVGNLIVDYSNGIINVEYDLFDHFKLSEVHLYIGCDPYPQKGKSQTVAPGQFTFKYDNLELLNNFKISEIDVEGINGSVYIIAHAVICASEAENSSAEKIAKSRISCDKNSKQSSDLRVYPVPFTDEFTVQYSFDYDTKISFQLYDLRGQLLRTLKTNYRSKLKFDQVKFDVQNIEAQPLILRVTTEKQLITKNVIKSN